MGSAPSSRWKSRKSFCRAVVYRKPVLKAWLPVTYEAEPRYESVLNGLSRLVAPHVGKAAIFRSTASVAASRIPGTSFAEYDCPGQWTNWGCTDIPASSRSRLVTVDDQPT